MLIKKIIVTLASLTVINAYADQISLSALGETAYCKTGHLCDLKGVHDIQITNDSDSQQTYTYIYEVYTMFNSQKLVRAFVRNQISVAPHGTWNNHHDSLGKTGADSNNGAYYVVTDVMRDKIYHAENKYRIITN